MTPLSYDPLDYAAEFSTEMCPEGVVAVSGEKLRIFGVERLGEMFNQAALPLRSALHKLCKGESTLWSDTVSCSVSRWISPLLHSVSADACMWGPPG